MGSVFVTVVGVIILVILLPNCAHSTCPDIITRAEWNASDPTSTKPLKEDPPPYVVVHHSVTRMCNTTADCKALVKSIQNYHMIDNAWEDIGYQFLIGDDGNIYEGRGWGLHGAHSIPYNARSIGVCLIGNFEEYQPLKNQLEALQNLIDCGIEKGKLASDYHLIGHNQASATLCPGKYLYNEIQQWSHFDSSPT